MGRVLTALCLNIPICEMGIMCIFLLELLSGSDETVWKVPVWQPLAPTP